MLTFHVHFFFFRKITILDCIEKCVKRGRLNRSNKYVNKMSLGLEQNKSLRALNPERSSNYNGQW